MEIRAESQVERKVNTFIPKPHQSDNAVNPDGAIRLAPLLESCLTLKTLVLNNTGVGPAGGEVMASDE